MVISLSIKREKWQYNESSPTRIRRMEVIGMASIHFIFFLYSQKQSFVRDSMIKYAIVVRIAFYKKFVIPNNDKKILNSIPLKKITSRYIHETIMLHYFNWAMLLLFISDIGKIKYYNFYLRYIFFQNFLIMRLKKKSVNNIIFTKYIDFHHEIYFEFLNMWLYVALVNSLMFSLRCTSYRYNGLWSISMCFRNDIVHFDNQLWVWVRYIIVGWTA